MKLELIDIHKHFGRVRANDGISLTVTSGSIQGLLGENGAGKSTLMKVLSGFIHADHGQILLNGRPARIASPADAIRHGIGMLHQDPLDVPPLTVVENLLLGSPSGFFPRRAEAERALRDLQARFGFSLDPQRYVDGLTVGERQQLEILRLLWLGANVLIFDEPTTGISLPQKEKLFDTLRLLAEQGKTVLFVSHKLEEVEELCQRVAVLRRGALVGEAAPPYRTEALVQMMFGKDIPAPTRAAIPPGEPALELEGLEFEDERLRIRDVNVRLCAGEVVGLAGMEGSGQSLLLRLCAGLRRPVGGRIRMAGREMTGRPYGAYLEQGVAYLPAARLEEGLIPGLTLAEHFMLTEASPGFFIDRARAQALARERIAEFSIRGRPESPVESLSGGNQQRALLALLRSPLALLLLEHPTRGLDLESAAQIWLKLKERCREGAAVLFISSDLEEILQYSDRVLVFFGGRVSEPLEASTTTVDELGRRIGGAGWQRA